MMLIGFTPYVISLIPVFINDPKLSVYALFPKPYFVTSLPLSGWPLISRYLHLLTLLLSELLVFLLAFLIKTKDKWQTALSLCLFAITLVLAFAPLVVFQYLVWAFPLTLLCKNSLFICHSPDSIGRVIYAFGKPCAIGIICTTKPRLLFIAGNFQPTYK